MKKLFLAVLLLLAIPGASHAQWGGGYPAVTTQFVKDLVSYRDSWFSTNSRQSSDNSIDLSAYQSLRTDFDISGTNAKFNVNLMCSNGSLWFSGSSISVTSDTYRTDDLVGCNDYVYYIESYSGVEPTLTIYYSPYDHK